MKYAKKIALQNDLDREYRRVTRPAASVRQSALSLNIRRILNNRKKNDDQKVKDYVFALHRYLNAGRKLPQISLVRLPPPPPPSPPPQSPPPDSEFPLTPPQFDYLAASPDDRPQPSSKKKKDNFTDKATFNIQTESETEIEKNPQHPMGTESISWKSCTAISGFRVVIPVSRPQDVTAVNRDDT